MDTKKIIQIGVVVKDIATAEEWGKFFGVEPKYGQTDVCEVTGATYKGEPCRGLCKQAFLNMDNVQIELIAPFGDGDSVWQAGLKETNEGLHHLALLSDDLKGTLDELNEKGFSVLQSGNWYGKIPGSYAYIDTSEKLKTIIEVMQRDV